MSSRLVPYRPKQRIVINAPHTITRRFEALISRFFGVEMLVRPCGSKSVCCFEANNHNAIYKAIAYLKRNTVNK